MNNCCSNKPVLKDYPASHCCPANGKVYSEVKRRTLLHHISRPWDHALREQGYYFCTDPDCDVVYFGQDNTVILSGQLRSDIWQKSKDKNATICHCFGITKKELESDESIKNFVITQTKEAICSCETSNPSGRCCLKDFPKS